MISKKITLLLTLLLVTVCSFFSTTAFAENQLILFYGQGCPHCGKVLEYLQSSPLKDSVVLKEIYFDHANAELYNSTLDSLSIPLAERGVPILVSGELYLVGDQPIIDYLDSLSSPSPSTPSPTPAPQPASSFSLTIFAVIMAALVDAINPCAFAVLIILMTTVLASGQKKRALATGLAFTTSIFFSYLLMGLGLYQALSLGNLSQIFFKIIGYLALTLGLFNLKDYFWYGKGFLMEVPLAWRPRLQSLLKSVTSPTGAFAIGFVVSLFLLPCTSGPYLVILGMLAHQETYLTAFAYLVLYNLIFVLPMLVITYGVSHGLDPQRLEQIRRGKLRLLHLIAALVLIGMGLALILGWL
jgi:cytochrome c biogenesis protein CcdA/glutaredoxin